MNSFIYLSYATPDDENTHNLITLWLIPKLRKRLRMELGIENAEVLAAANVDTGSDRYRTLGSQLAASALHVSLVSPTLFRSSVWLQDLRWFLKEREPALPFKTIVAVEFIHTIELSEREHSLPNNPEHQRDDPASVLLQFGPIRLETDVFDLSLEGGAAWNESKQLQSLVREIVERVVDAHKALPLSSLGADGGNQAEPIHQHPLLPVEPVIPKRADEGEPSTNQLRIEEFAREKAFLGQYFADFLHKRLTRLRSYQGGGPVLLLVDAGTTLFPVIRELGKIARSGSSLDHVCMVTNNLPAVRWLLRNGRPAENKWKEICLKTVLLPGVPLPAYSAATGWEPGDGFDGFEGIIGHLQTHQIVEQIGRLKREGWPGRIIAVVTGNWVRVRRTFPSIAVPLARGRGHLLLKQALCDVADEVYVLAPLGKVVTGEKPEVLATLSEVSPPHSKQQEYEEVQTGGDFAASQDDSGRDEGGPEDLAGKMQLVTTYRLPNRLLSGVSDFLQRPEYILARQIHAANYAEMRHAFGERSYRSHWMFLFDDLASDLAVEAQQEFPHDAAWTPRFFNLVNVKPELQEKLFQHRRAGQNGEEAQQS